MMCTFILATNLWVTTQLAVHRHQIIVFAAEVQTSLINGRYARGEIRQIMEDIVKNNNKYLYFLQSPKHKNNFTHINFLFANLVHFTFLLYLVIFDK